MKPIDDTHWRPKTAEGVEVHPTEDGCIVYQAGGERVHNLNATAAVLLALCTGRNRAAEFPDLLQSIFGLADPPKHETRACLEQLVAEQLIL